MKDILDKLQDLHQQATNEQSHYYVASCCREAIAEIVSRRSDGAALARENAMLREACESAAAYLDEDNSRGGYRVYCELRDAIKKGAR